MRTGYCACGDSAELRCTHCHEPTCIDCMAEGSTTLCRDCDTDDTTTSETPT